MKNAALHLRDMIGGDAFPCVGAKAALAHDHIEFLQGASITSPQQDDAICQALTDFARRQGPDALYTSFILLFDDEIPMSETEFEKHLWQRLQGIHNADPAPWDKSVSSDPQASDFSFSIGGHGFYIIGLHPGASRPARRAAFPALVFNLHSQFETLRTNGQYDHMRDIIRQRDIDFCGSTNPMLANFGDAPEALQYSGRKVDRAWACPFHPKPGAA